MQGKLNSINYFFPFRRRWRAWGFEPGVVGSKVDADECTYRANVNFVGNATMQK